MMTKKFVQKLRMASRKIFGLFLICELFSVSCSLRLQIYELFNELTLYSGTYNKRRIIMAKSTKKLDSKLRKQQQGWPKLSNTARKHDKDENLENYDSEVQMYARAHSEPRLAN